MLLLLGLLVAAAGTAGGAVAEPADDGLRRASLRHDGVERSYALYAPPGLDQEGAELPVVLVLHGSGGSADRIRAFTDRRFERLADRHGFLVVYPEGFEGNWNGCRKRNPSSANRLDVDDPGFLRALVRRLQAERGDGEGARGGVLAFGFSGGAHLAFRLALEAPDLVDAVVAVGAGLPDPGDSDCAPRGEPVTVALIDGTEDPINPYAGGDVVLPEILGGAVLGRVLSAEASAEYFASLAGHAGPPSLTVDPDRDGDPSTAVERRVWSAGDGRPEVVLLTVRGGGHTIPQPPPTRAPFPAFAGPMSTEIDAVHEAWELFRHRRHAER